MTTRDILVAAKARLTSETWGQAPINAMSHLSYNVGDYFKSIGKECPYLAVGRTVPDDPVGYGSATQALRAALGFEMDGLVSVWNDQPGRTLAEVHTLFDRAIAACPKAS